MTRQEINLGAPGTGAGGDTTRSAAVKINSMTTELYPGLDAVNKGGWGKATPIVMAAGSNPSDLVATGMYMFNDGSGLPDNNQPYWFIEHLSQGAGWASQRATRFTDARIFTRYRHGGEAKWYPWVETLRKGEYLGNGLAGNNEYTGNIDTLWKSASWGLTSYRLTAATTGNIPPGYADFNTGVLEINKWNDDWGSMKLSLQGREYVRSGVPMSQVWQMVYDTRNVLTPVDIGGTVAGIMDLRNVGGWQVMRFRNGSGIATAQGLQNVTAGANQIVNVNQQLGFDISNYGEAFPIISIQPTQSWDHYGIISSYMSGPNTISFALRNGPTPQTFGFTRVAVIYRWA